MNDMDQARLRRIERQLDYLFQHFGIDPRVVDAQPVGLPGDFYAALQAGKMINAIKIYREVTGVGLKEAKDAVEAIARQR